MIGSPTILLTGDPFEVFVGIVEDISVLVVSFEWYSVLTDRSWSLECKEDDDMAIPISKFAHLRVIASGLSVAAIFARSSARGREVIKDFSESVPGEREEMPHAIGIEGGFTPAFFGNHALGEG